jgi:peptide/nickel transport system permease protein
MDTTGSPLSPPSQIHLFGTDDLGGDTLTGVIWGSRASLVIGILTAGLSTIVGAVVGIIAGYKGGVIDSLVMRSAEIVLVIPLFILAVVVIAFFGSSVVNTVLVIAALLWPGSARIARAEFIRLKPLDFVESARSTGLKDRSIIFSEILPNAMGPIIVTWTLDVAWAILTESGLSFIGLGDVNFPSWGVMLERSMHFMSQAWWMSVFPGLAIFFVVFSFNLLGDGLGDALSPKLEKLEKAEVERWTPTLRLS